ncbi:MAG: class I SAM-dependent methyltransferase [Acidobacteriaceae bacterium]|nr:class I SAM-dependent methyltransferase [Acidobacteriaceae bacterium]
MGIPLPPDLDSAIDAAWAKARNVPGYIGEEEFRALGMLFTGAPSEGVAVEIGSFKGKSTVGLAALAAHYGFSPVISIDPHDAPCSTDPMLGGKDSSFDDFQSALRTAGLAPQVEVHRALSRDVAGEWNRPIRFLWIDGDHTYDGAKLDFDSFSPYLVEGGIVALHDTLHEFEGPIRVFVENMLQSDKFGPAGLLHTIGWAQYRPRDGAKFRGERERLARRASKLIPLVANGRRLSGLSKKYWKLLCAFVPHPILSPAEWERALNARE